MVCLKTYHTNVLLANQLNVEFRDAQWRGMPLPILWIAEYFTLDGENIRWNRGYRQAGFYTHILLWAAFGLWFIANVLFLFAPRAGYYIWGLIGTVLLTSVIVYSGVIHKWPVLKIAFRDEVLDLAYGWSFWLVVATGIFCVVSSVCLFILDKVYPLQFVLLFDLIVEDDPEEIHCKASQRQKTIRKSRKLKSQVVPFHQDENETFHEEPIGNGKTSTASGSAVQMHVIALAESTT